MQDSMIILLLTLLAAFYDEAVALYFFITTKSFIKNSLKATSKNPNLPKQTRFQRFFDSEFLN